MKEFELIFYFFGGIFIGFYVLPYLETMFQMFKYTQRVKEIQKKTKFEDEFKADYERIISDYRNEFNLKTKEVRNFYEQYYTLSDSGKINFLNSCLKREKVISEILENLKKGTDFEIEKFRFILRDDQNNL